MKNTAIFLAFITLITGTLVAQNNDVGGADLTTSSVANPELSWVVLDRFEDDGFWTVDMPADHGIITLRRFEGGPDLTSNIHEEFTLLTQDEELVEVDEQDRYVLGVKVEFLRRAVTHFTVTPARPIPIPGITKQIGAFVVGRNMEHELYVMVEDMFGNTAKLPMDELIHSGWEFLSTQISSNPRTEHLVQKDPHYNDREGVFITQFLVELDPVKTFGTYYFYMDKLVAQTDLYSSNIRDDNDMADFW